MKEIFTDIYKKVAGFFQAMPEKENVKEVACNRLKFVLMQDRTNLNPQLLERMRNEMIDLLSKYLLLENLKLNPTSQPYCSNKGKSSVKYLLTPPIF